MKKIGIIFWSGSGNTEAMAHALAEGIGNTQACSEVFYVGDISASDIASYQALAFGCPAMGAEELEEAEFAPFFTQCEARLKDVPLALFGSYGWGSGEWMETWRIRCKEAGAQVVGTVIAQGYPDEQTLADCKNLGARLAGLN